MGRREEHALKQLLRITILLIGLIWILAWAAAGRFDSAAAPAADGESSVSSGEPAAPGERDSADLLHVLIRGEVQEMDMGTYLLGVLRAEMPASFEEEALKAQAIAARTYTLYRIRGGGSAMFVVKMDLISIWGIVIPLSFIMAFVVKASPAAVVCCLNADQIFKCVPAFIKSNYGNWVRKLTME